ncbi:MAG: alanine-zipper protein, partial [Synechococcales bacterium]|nr:alanine-zipper protein [Synechococcales bacterium]
ESLGFFLGIHNNQLRYFSVEGKLIPTPEEAAKDGMRKAEQATAKAEQATAKAEQAILRAEQEKSRADRLAEKLEALGIDLDSVLNS